MSTSAFRNQGDQHSLTLPHGRHALSREIVRASQRGRMLDAMADVVYEKGYGATTVAAVTEKAGVSRKTFYEQFSDKEACFLAAFDTGVAVLVGFLREEAEEIEGWRERLQVGLEAFFRLLSEEPAFTHLLAVEALAAGPVSRRRRGALVAGFAEVYRRTNEEARAEDPAIAPIHEQQCRAIAGGVDEVIRGYVEQGRIADLPELNEEMLDFVMANVARRA